MSILRHLSYYITDIIAQEMLDLNAPGIEDPLHLDAEPGSEDGEEVVETVVHEKSDIHEGTDSMNVDSVVAANTHEPEEDESAAKDQTEIEVRLKGSHVLNNAHKQQQEIPIKKSVTTVIQTIEMIHEGHVREPSPPAAEESIEDVHSPEVQKQDLHAPPPEPEGQQAADLERPMSTQIQDTVVDAPTRERSQPTLVFSKTYIPFSERDSPKPSISSLHSPVQVADSLAETTAENFPDFSSFTNPLMKDYRPLSPLNNPQHDQNLQTLKTNLSELSNTKSVVDEPKQYINPYIPVYLTSTPPVPSQEPAQNTALVHDPYPLNLSTPGFDAGSDSDEESDQDDREPETSMTSVTDGEKPGSSSKDGPATPAIAGSSKGRSTNSAINTDIQRPPGREVTPVTPTNAALPNGHLDDTPQSIARPEAQAEGSKAANGKFMSVDHLMSSNMVLNPGFVDKHMTRCRLPLSVDHGSRSQRERNERSRTPSQTTVANSKEV